MQTAEETHEASNMQQAVEPVEPVEPMEPDEPEAAQASLASFTLRDVASMAESPVSDEWGLSLIHI